MTIFKQRENPAVHRGEDVTFTFASKSLDPASVSVTTSGTNSNIKTTNGTVVSQPGSYSQISETFLLTIGKWI